jgi:hypothetical protein
VSEDARTATVNAALLQRVEELHRLLHEANYEYYVLDAPTMSDAEWDGLLRELKEIEAAHPELVTPDSPTQRVGAEPATQFRKVQHLAPMYSLDNAFSETELRAWEDRNARIADEVRTAGYSAELKIDGTAVTLRYEDGVLVRGGDARQRHDRRGHHAEHPHDPRDPAPTARDARAARRDGGARRSVHAAFRVPRDEREPGRGR